MIHTIPVRPMCRDYAAGIDAPIAGTVIGVPWRWLEEEAPCTPETRAGLNAALAVFRDLGATIRGVEPPPMQLFNDAKKIIAIAELYSIHEKDLKTRPELFGASLRYRIIAGSLVRAEDYVQAMRVRRDLASAMQQIFTTIDLMMLPTGEPAGKLEPVPHYTLFTDPFYTTAFKRQRQSGVVGVQRLCGKRHAAILADRRPAVRGRDCVARGSRL
jgi:aspartyl-tRNA(Asn)/glutamyl-tRNA(Gln) amidotransferase subunit A